MNLVEAIAILNERRHRSFCDWYQHGEYVRHELSDPGEALDTFEAIAVAEKYQRDACLVNDNTTT